MIFDKLLGIVEHQLLQFKDIMRDAKIFEFPYIAHKVLPKSVSEEEWGSDEFFLPFPSTVIEDKASCIVLYDTVKNQIGLKERRGFIECMTLDADVTAFREYNENNENNKSLERFKNSELHEKGFCVVNTGFIYEMQYVNDKEFVGGGEIEKSMVLSKNAIYCRDLIKDYTIAHIGEELDENQFHGPIINAYTAIQELQYFNTPKNFILEISPKKEKKRSKKLLRSHERPVYTILRPEEIRKKMGLSVKVGDRNSPVPHERRRHERFLSDPVYSKDENGEKLIAKVIPYGHRKGESYFKKVIVPATWIGSSETVKGNKRYKVLLNK